jgi:sugar phosphate isomerase/epimerase
MNISVVTDEVSADPETAIELGIEWGVRHFELRGVGGERVPVLSDFHKARLDELVDEYQIEIVAISPGLFKCPYPPKKRERFSLRTFDQALYQGWRSAHDLVQYQLEELLPASVEYALKMKAGLIVAFSFDRAGQPPGPAPDGALEALQQAAGLVGKFGLKLAIEVEDGFWADTGQSTAALLESVNHPALMVNWDPGNAFAAGDIPYPDGYQEIRSRVAHVHFKDAVRQPDGTCTYVVEGQIDWAGQIEALVRDDYRGCISIETHMQPKVRSARQAVERLASLIEAKGGKS